jgi:hypothetical protein
MSRSKGDSSAARPRERLAQQGRIDPPRAFDALDDGRLAGLASPEAWLDAFFDSAIGAGSPARG